MNKKKLDNGIRNIFDSKDNGIQIWCDKEYVYFNIGNCTISLCHGEEFNMVHNGMLEYAEMVRDR